MYQYFLTFRSQQWHSHWRGQGAMARHFNFQTRQGPQVSVSKIAFYGCLEIIRTKDFTVFIVDATIFGQFIAAFHFFLTT